MEHDAKIYVAGHGGLVGSAIVRKLKAQGYSDILTASTSELDLRDQGATRRFFERERPEYVLLAAARVGGILANNTRPAEFIYDNMAIQTNVIHSAYVCGVNKLLFLGSSCIYPKLAPQPMKEEYLLTGALEPTNEAYAVAKIAGIKMCQSYHAQYGCNFISLMPTNLYGPGDNFDPEGSHVIPALIRKFVEAVDTGADTVEVWGTGTPRREFLHVDDLAAGCVFLMNNYDSPEIINVGTGADISIAELAGIVGELSGFTGAVRFDSSKPDGTPRKLLDTSRINGLGWKPEIGLAEGLRQTIEWYRRTRAVPPS